MRIFAPDPAAVAFGRRMARRLLAKTAEALAPVPAPAAPVPPPIPRPAPAAPVPPPAPMPAQQPPQMPPPQRPYSGPPAMRPETGRAAERRAAGMFNGAAKPRPKFDVAHARQIIEQYGPKDRRSPFYIDAPNASDDQIAHIAAQLGRIPPGQQPQTAVQRAFYKKYNGEWPEYAPAAP